MITNSKPCAWTENWISIETDGFTRPCCGETDIQARIAPITQGILAAFNDSKLIELSETLHTQGYNAATEPYCHRCRELEDNKKSNLRSGTLRLTDTRQLSAIQFKMSNKCQLACAHCGPDRSSTWAKLLDITPHVQNSFALSEDFITELKRLIPQLQILKFTGGEPFLDPDHWRILERLQDTDYSHIELQYITNGLVKPRSDLWQGFKSVNCSISADGYEDTYAWFRRNATWAELNDGVELLKKHATVTISYAVTPWTYKDVDRARNYWNLPFECTNVVYPAHQNLHRFPRLAAEAGLKHFSAFGADAEKIENTLNQYKNFALQWDLQWNTPGWAEKLYPWLNN
jgi:organic radical activating enzyme